ncbi:hypothetical protein P9112_004107 [Eukaryota sp. TZLM1-RC]
MSASILNVLSAADVSRRDSLNPVIQSLLQKLTSSIVESPVYDVQKLLPHVIPHSSSTLLQPVISCILSHKGLTDQVLSTVAPLLPQSIHENHIALSPFYKANVSIFVNQLSLRFEQQILSLDSSHFFAHQTSPLASQLHEFCRQCGQGIASESFFFPVTFSWLRDCIKTPFAGQIFATLLALSADITHTRLYKFPLHTPFKHILPVPPLADPKPGCKRKICSQISALLSKTEHDCLLFRDIGFACAGPLSHSYYSFLTFNAVKEAALTEQKPDTILNTLHEEQVYLPFTLLCISSIWPLARSSGIPPEDSSAAALLTSVMIIDVKRRTRLHFSNVDRTSQVCSFCHQSLSLPLARMLFTHYLIDLVSIGDLDGLGFLLNNEFNYTLCSWGIHLMFMKLDALHNKISEDKFRQISIFLFVILGKNLKSFSGASSYFQNNLYSLVGYSNEFKECLSYSLAIFDKFLPLCLSGGRCYSIQEAEFVAQALSLCVCGISNFDKNLIDDFIVTLTGKLMNFGELNNLLMDYLGRMD